MFQPGIFEICRTLEPSGRGEYEITEAIQALIDEGKRVEPHVVTGWWKDTGKWRTCWRRTGSCSRRSSPRSPARSSTRRWRDAWPSPGARLERCRVEGPASIGEGADVLKDAYIGPYTAVAEGCEIERAEIENSIILENSRITDLHHRLEGSLIGRNVIIGGQTEAQRLPDPRRRRLAHRDPVIEGVRLIPLRKFEDERGWFTEIRRESTMPKPTLQTNVAFSRAGVIRGLHYHERGQDDLFVCLHGMVRVVLLTARPARRSPATSETRIRKPCTSRAVSRTATKP